MRLLSLTQPWATLLALGQKRFDTRCWSTSYRGMVAIHAAESFPREERALCDVWPFNKYITSAKSLPLGCILAVGQLQGVFTTGHIVKKLLLRDSKADKEELRFGDYSDGRFAWGFVDVRPLRQPVPCRGAFGLTWLDPATEELVTKF